MVLSFYVAIGLASAGQINQLQPETKKPALSVKTLKTSYMEFEPIAVSVSVTNDTANVIRFYFDPIFCWEPSGPLGFQLDMATPFAAVPAGKGLGKFGPLAGPFPMSVKLRPGRNLNTILSVYELKPLEQIKLEFFLQTEIYQPQLGRYKIPFTYNFDYQAILDHKDRAQKTVRARGDLEFEISALKEKSLHELLQERLTQLKDLAGKPGTRGEWEATLAICVVEHPIVIPYLLKLAKSRPGMAEAALTRFSREEIEAAKRR